MGSSPQTERGDKYNNQKRCTNCLILTDTTLHLNAHFSSKIHRKVMYLIWSHINVLHAILSPCYRQKQIYWQFISAAACEKILTLDKLSCEDLLSEGLSLLIHSYTSFTLNLRICESAIAPLTLNFDASHSVWSVSVFSLTMSSAMCTCFEFAIIRFTHMLAKLVGSIIP